jgi:PAS domain S-box-containing protein
VATVGGEVRRGSARDGPSPFDTGPASDPATNQFDIVGLSDATKRCACDPLQLRVMMREHTAGSRAHFRIRRLDCERTATHGIRFIRKSHGAGSDLAFARIVAGTGIVISYRALVLTRLWGIPLSGGAPGNSHRCIELQLNFLLQPLIAIASEMAVPLHDNTGAVVPLGLSERRRAEDALRRNAEQQALLLEVTSDLIRASEPGELGRVTFEHISSAFGADICFNYRLDPAGQHLRLVFVHGIPPEPLKAAQSLELGQAFCGTAAGGCEAVVADKHRIASDPKGVFVRGLGATAYACHPLMAADGRVLGTFSVASTTRECFTDDEVAWLGTITNFLAQAWERFEAEQGLRVSEERLRLSQEAAGLGHWDFDFACGTLVWSEQTRKLLGVERTTPASRVLLLSLVHAEDRSRLEEHIARSARPDSGHRRHLEFRIVMQNGAVRWLQDQSQVETNAAGMPVRAVGIVRDITEGKLAEQALRASKDRLQLALNAAQLGWWQYDPLSGVILGDARLKEIFDFTADETPIEEFVKRVHPDDVERVLADREAALDPADPKPYAHKYQVQRRDGEVRWVEAHGLAYFEGGGRERRAVSFIGTVQDITERKQHEEREHLLMREVNHRAKNMLSVVDAIAHQTATRNPEDFVERFSDRIQALSANQDLLVRNEWKGVDVEDLVRAQLAHFADVVGARIAMQGPKLRLNPASAQAIGLALHELGTNAGKYGALSTDTGRVDIGWGTDGDTLTMSWTERDGPQVSAPKRRGFGTIVMEAMAERSIGGKVNLDYAPSGVTWRLTCPAANALEPREREQNFMGRRKST